jgi:F1F0 ATPase subunit 2
MRKIRERKNNMDYYFTITNFFVGLGLGVIFFGGLFLTVHKLGDYPNPGVITLASFLLRTAIVMAGFYSIILNDKSGLIPGLVGFAISMISVRVFTSLPEWVRNSGADSERKGITNSSNIKK